MEAIILKDRDQLLAQVRELRSEKIKDDYEMDSLVIEENLAMHFTTLPMIKLTSDLLATGTTFVGFLYNKGFDAFVSTKEDQKWLYAAKDTPEGAVRFNVNQDSVGNLVLTAKIAGYMEYFNWRAITGAVKLYDFYDTIVAKNWMGSTFQIYNPDNMEFIGTWSETDNELYNRDDVVNLDFEFHVFDIDAFSDDDKLVYNIYMKNV